MGECFTERIESMPNGELISVTINDGIKKFSELGRHDNSNDDKSKYKKVCVGDIAYNSMRMWQGASGYSPYEGIVSPAYTVLAANHGVNSRCIAHQFKLSKMIHTFKINSQGITSDNWNLKFPTLSDISIYISRSIDEQGKIASLLESLDHLITLHQSKSFGHILEVIVSCTLSWEQRKFGELFLEKRDKTEIEDEDILLSCAITGIYLNSELFSHFRGTSNIGYLKIKKNDLILSAQNLHLGNANVNLLFEHGIISPAYKVYELNKCDQYFVQSWVKKDSTKDFFLNATTEGASQCRKNIDWCILNNQLIAIPSLYEQISIGKLFHCLNHLITLHQLEPFQLIFKAIAYRIIDYAKSKPPRCRKYTGFIAFINTMYKNCVYTQYNHLYSLKSYYIKDIILLIKSAYICKIII